MATLPPSLVLLTVLLLFFLMIEDSGQRDQESGSSSFALIHVCLFLSMFGLPCCLATLLCLMMAQDW